MLTLAPFIKHSYLTAAKVDKIFWNYQSCQLVKNYQRSRDHTCSHHQDLVPETSIIFNQLTRGFLSVLNVCCFLRQERNLHHKTVCKIIVFMPWYLCLTTTVQTHCFPMSNIIIHFFHFGKKIKEFGYNFSICHTSNAIHSLNLYCRDNFVSKTQLKTPKFRIYIQIVNCAFLFCFWIREERNEITEFLKWNQKRSGQATSVCEDEELERGGICMFSASHNYFKPTFTKRKSKANMFLRREDKITRCIVSSNHILLYRSTCQISRIFSKLSYEKQEICICLRSQFLFRASIPVLRRYFR